MEDSASRHFVLGIGRNKETWKAVWYFFALQIFFVVMMVSLNTGNQGIFIMALFIPPLIGFLTGRRQGLLLIYYFIIITFTVGQRSLFFGQYFRIVPAGILLWALAILSLFVKPRIPLNQPFPIAVIALFFFTLFACLYREWWANLNFSLFYAHMMWLAIPAFFVTRRLIQRLEQVQTIGLIIGFGCFFLSFLALSEFFNFGYIRYFGNYFWSSNVIATSGFHRLGAFFWGGPMLAGYLTLCFPLICSQFLISKTGVQKTILAISIVLIGLTIYFSGHRGLWAAFLVGMGYFFYLRGIKGVMILVLLAILGFQFIPQEAKLRMGTLYGEKRDSSSETREQRAKFALQLIEKKPIQGHGWGKSGLVHSDLLQLWADSGLGALISLLGLFAMIIIRLKRSLKWVKNKIFREYFYGFSASLASVFIILCNQAWFNLAEQYTPFWVVMALAYQYPTIVQIENHIIKQQIESSSSRANAASI